MKIKEIYKFQILNYKIRNVIGNDWLPGSWKNSINMDLKVSVSYFADGHKAITRKVNNLWNSGLWCNFHWRLHKNRYPLVQFESISHARTSMTNWTSHLDLRKTHWFTQLTKRSGTRSSKYFFCYQEMARWRFVKKTSCQKNRLLFGHILRTHKSLGRKTRQNLITKNCPWRGVIHLHSAIIIGRPATLNLNHVKAQKERPINWQKTRHFLEVSRQR